MSGGRSYIEEGGAGTAYVYTTDAQTGRSTSKLYVDNNGYKPLNTYINDPAADSARTYVVHKDEYGFSRYDFDEVRLTGSAHLAFVSQSADDVPINVQHLHGDKTGFLHITEGMPTLVNNSDSPFPSAFRIYPNSRLHTPEGR